MNLIRIIILCCVVGLSACQSADQATTAANNDTVATMKVATDSNMITASIDSSHTAQNSLAWKGSYKGILPCADCEGIETTIMLHEDNTYMISTKYLGKKDSRSFTGEGKFTWINGNTIHLTGAKDEPANYFVTENKIIQTDVEGKKISGVLAEKYILNKTSN